MRDPAVVTLRVTIPYRVAPRAHRPAASAHGLRHERAVDAPTGLRWVLIVLGPTTALRR